ncbi:MAG: tetratricopeptide repeat protein [marine benthic group bacterium]|nr:tetratricopeptide repeat protein [Candidatus Benthicola marisminoris]
METSRFWSAEEYDRQAQRLYETGDYDGALEMLRRGVALYPDSVELGVSIGYTYLAREEYVWARRSFRQALQLEPDHEDALVGLGESHLKLGERARGFQCFERILDLGFARDLDLMLSVGRALFREGLWEHAERFFRRAIAANEKSPEAAADLAYTLHRQGDGVQARMWLDRCLELDAENHDARVLLANLFYDGGEPEKALEHFERIPLESLWDPVSVWRLVELVRAYREVTSGACELDPYLDRLDQLFVDPSPEERILLEVEMEAAGLTAPIPASRDQLDLFGGDPDMAPGAHRMDWTGIVRAMCESSADPAQSVEEFMRETARRVRDTTGIQIPDDDPEAFLKASARAGVLHIDR